MKNLTKIFAALLSLCAITSLLLLGAHAFGETEPIDEVEGEKVDWTYNFTENTLTHGEVVYEEYFMPSGFDIFACEYTYAGSITMSEYSSGQATLTEDGRITGVSEGTVYLTLKCEGYQDLSVNVNVIAAPTGMIINSCISNPLEAWAPPFKIFIIGTGITLLLTPPT